MLLKELYKKRQKIEVALNEMWPIAAFKLNQAREAQQRFADCAIQFKKNTRMLMERLLGCSN